MSTTYQGGLGTTVTVRPADSTVTVGFDSTIVLIGINDSGNANLEEAVFLETKQDAIDAFGESSEITKAYTAAAANGAAEIWGVAADDSSNWSGAAEEAMGLDPRYIVVCSETDSNQTDVLGVVSSWANDLEFARVFAPAEDVSASNVSTYTPANEDQRFIEVAPLRTTVGGKDAYAAAAVAGHAARQPLGSSITYDSLNIEDASLEYRRSTAEDFEQVTAITRDGQVAEGVTTSAEDAFKDIFQVEIVDTVTLGLDEIGQSYAGSRPNISEARRSLRKDVREFLGPLTTGRPPLLADSQGGPAYSVGTQATGDESVDLNVGVSPVDVMKQIDINMNVGSVVGFEGYEA